MRCCDNGGCWKSRTVALGDGDEKDKDLCVDVVGTLPRCMDMITADEVIRRIEMYFQGGAIQYLPEAAALRRTRQPRGSETHEKAQARRIGQAIGAVS